MSLTNSHAQNWSEAFSVNLMLTRETRQSFARCLHHYFSYADVCGKLYCARFLPRLARSALDQTLTGSGITAAKPDTGLDSYEKAVTCECWVFSPVWLDAVESDQT